MCVLFLFLFFSRCEDIKTEDINIEIDAYISFMVLILNHYTTQQQIYITLPLFTIQGLVVKKGQA